MQSVARYTLFPVLMTAGIAASAAALGAGASRVTVLTCITMAFFFLILALERVLPHRGDWLLDDGQIGNDVGHALFGTMLGGVVGNVVVQAGYALYARTQHPSSTWPSHWPFAAQLLVVFLLADLGRYWQHWCLHRIEPLWRFHSLHHSGLRLTVWKTTRSHIAERIVQQIFMYSLLTLIGAPESVVFWYILPNSLLGLFAHANLGITLGPIEYVVMGPAAHRLHHSAAKAENQRNYGSALVVWDIIFGSFANPCRLPSPARVGLDNDTTPRTFLAQVLEPMRTKLGAARGAHHPAP